ncbi:MAG: beta-ketoacyl synthase N-terminal-like domain-containing protein [Geobacteraceae bacterium]|nr:beta-ketoacyl synthase N-terminal-like domain-containing protein [Geobacteraceae bacterium]
MKILGTGIIFTRGQGIGVLENSLRSGWVKPAEMDVPRTEGNTRPVYQVDLDAVQDRSLLKKLRRADKLSKMSVLAAADALADSGIADIARKKIGIILATAFGAQVTTFDFLDGILDYGDAAVSPTTFSNSVHNAAASYVSSSLNIRGPTLTVTQFRFSFQSALQLAQTWLEQGRCDYLLAGAVDQYGDVLGYIAEQKLTAAQDGRIKPFVFNPTCQVPGEGALFFLLGNDRTDSAYCSIDSVSTSGDPDCGKPVDINLIDADGMLPDESAYLSALSPDTLTTAYAPIFGSMMIGGAFNLATAALMLKQQTHYAAPVLDNPHALLLLSETGPAHIGSIRSIGCNCFGEKSVVYLSKLT